MRPGAEAGGGDAHGGQGPEARWPVAARMAAPVGVVSSTGRSRPHVGIPRSNRTTAGEGLGRNPCALRTVPMPVATGEAATSSMPRISIAAAAVPTTSITVSCDPTSWKWTCSGRAAMEPHPRPRPAPRTCPEPGGSPARAGGPLRRDRRCGHGSAPRRRRSVSTTARVAAIPARSTGSARRLHPPRGRRCNIESTSEKSAPASRRLPSAMSPAMPAKQWNQATRVRPSFGRRRPGWRGRTCHPQRRARRSRQHPGDGAGSAEPVVDPDDGEPRRTRRVHGEQRGDAVERRSIARRHRYGHDRARR